jgi:hypothetical protein
VKLRPYSDGWDLDALYAEYLAGTTQTELARRLGCNAETVRVAFLRAGYAKRTMAEVNAVNTERAALKAKRVADNVRYQVVIAYRRGGTLAEVVKSTGIGYGLVQRVLREEGLINQRSTPKKRAIRRATGAEAKASAHDRDLGRWRDHYSR